MFFFEEGVVLIIVLVCGGGDGEGSELWDRMCVIEEEEGSRAVGFGTRLRKDWKDGFVGDRLLLSSCLVVGLLVVPV